ncbi:MAG: hypothetical protein KAS39_08975, partial [Actinomycetia bacterium]|nr:hypothetical protein [Actinomycetes bacterium]
NIHVKNSTNLIQTILNIADSPELHIILLGEDSMFSGSRDEELKKLDKFNQQYKSFEFIKFYPLLLPLNKITIHSVIQRSIKHLSN